jgi:5-deoxy-glucuronate isomerase
MLADTLIRTPRTAGLSVIQPAGAHGARELSGWRAHLAPGERASHRLPGHEMVVVLQEGSGTFRVGGTDGESASEGFQITDEWTVSRRGVFAERATALYVPPDVEVTITATTPLEAILIATPLTATARATDAVPVLRLPSDVEVLARGRGHYGRHVHNLFVTDPHARRLMVGETFNPPGNWSSFPPHKHDGRNGEPELEEVYHFRVDPPQGFGQQILYTNDGEEVTHVVRDGDVVVLPYGYHPVAAAPGYSLYYLWAMVGAERKLALYEDPAHRWIHDIPNA